MKKPQQIKWLKRVGEKECNITRNNKIYYNMNKTRKKGVRII